MTILHINAKKSYLDLVNINTYIAFCENMSVYSQDIKQKWVATWDFQQCGMCDQQRLKSACAYAQSDQSLC